MPTSLLTSKEPFCTCIVRKVSLTSRMRNIWFLISYLGRAQPPLLIGLLFILWSFCPQGTDSICLACWGWGGGLVHLSPASHPEQEVRGPHRPESYCQWTQLQPHSLLSYFLFPIIPDFQSQKEITMLCHTYCITDPMDCRLPGSSVHGILQASRLEWVVIPFSRGSSQPRDGTWVSCIAGGFFTIWDTREAHITDIF